MFWTITVPGSAERCPSIHATTLPTPDLEMMMRIRRTDNLVRAISDEDVEIPVWNALHEGSLLPAYHQRSMRRLG